MIMRPQSDEYAPYYAGYIQHVPLNIDLFALLSSQPAELSTLLQAVSDDQASIRPAPAEWSIKEVLGHVCDTERVFAYRALCFARADKAALPSMDQDEYVAGTDFNARTLSDLLEEFTLLRRANLLCFKPLTEAEIMRRGIASNNPITVRALLFILAGHVIHHIESLKTSYQVR
jgi:uncharacterized damage-inducible protein DinB